MTKFAQWAELATAGLHAHWRAQCGYVAGGEVAERHGVLVTATRLPDETLNVAFAPGPVPDPAAALDWLVAWFTERGLHPGIELRAGEHPEMERLLAARGFTVVVRRPAMVLSPIEVPSADARRVVVTEVDTDDDLAAFQAIQTEVFDMTPEVTAALLPRAAIETPGIRFFLARHDTVACGTAAASVSAYGVGIVGVATLPAYRRRGIGRAVTAAAARWGAAAGAELAWLYPSEMARPLYEGLGFRALDDTQVWVALAR
ncbi:MAG TPA: GNAT family N-acetyltransferase [Frankiaceae bacterium]|nr:GNAT family N-acetyltransferase [Frankiaceae bacterium]